MLLQIFILEACPDLQETKDDKRHTHTHAFRYTHIPSRWDSRHLAASCRTQNSKQIHPYTKNALSNCFAWSVMSPLKRPEPAETQESPSGLTCTGKRKERQKKKKAGISCKYSIFQLTDTLQKGVSCRCPTEALCFWACSHHNKV